MPRKTQPRKKALPAGVTFTDDFWPLDRIKPFDQNPREHPEDQVKKIARSMEEFGFTVPILVDPEGEIIAGHGRLMAAQRLGLDGAPVRIAAGLTEPQKRAYRIADNQLTFEGGWSDTALTGELKALEAEGFDLTLTGFDTVSVDGYLRGFGEGGEGGEDPGGAGSASLMDRFGVAPFSVLNAREGWWQDRKRAWISLGIRSEIGRGQEGDASAYPGQDRLNQMMADKPKRKGARS